MDKYIIINETYNAILCKDKYSSRRYRQDQNNIDKHCVIVKTTKGRAEQEKDYLNKNYNEGWEIQRVEPEEEVKRIEKETVEKIFNDIFALINNAKDKSSKIFGNSSDYGKGYKNSVSHFNEHILELAKQYGVEVQDDGTRTN